MNTSQIKCFLAVAQTLNFTKAAEQLFISQPGLSRQIVSLERELNTLLFIRESRNVRLTPAGVVLVKELEGFNSRYEELVNKVQKVGQGYSGTLVLGMLEGYFVSEELIDKNLKFISENPNIDVVVKQGSYGDLRKWLQSGEIDIAVTLKYEADNMNNIISVDFMPAPPVLVVSKHTEIGRKKNITREDLQKETIILVSPDDSLAASETGKRGLKAGNLKFAKVRYAPNQATAHLWVELGQGICFTGRDSYICCKPSIRIIDDLITDTGGAYNCFIWMAGNYNPAIPLWVENSK